MDFYNEYVLKKKDYFFFSLTSIEYNGYEKVIGIGIMGNVHISEEVEKELKKGNDVQKSKQKHTRWCTSWYGRFIRNVYWTFKSHIYCILPRHWRNYPWHLRGSHGSHLFITLDVPSRKALTHCYVNVLWF